MQAQIVDYLLASGVYVTPYLDPNRSRAAHCVCAGGRQGDRLEALPAGRGGIGWRTGILVPFRSQAELAEATLRILGNTDLKDRLEREGKKVGRDRVARLMEDMELSGVVRGKRKRTTVPTEKSARPADLVERNLTASAPNRLWVADLT